jgi:ubiquinone/menaquinone biosynthesis C-methylase UbiE
LGRRLIKAIHPEGIPWPGTVLYNAISRRGIFQQHYELVARDILGYRAEGRLLDIGTGPGWLLLKLHPLAPGLRLVGADISLAMVNKARRNVAQAGLSSTVEIVNATASNLPFPDGSFDLVVSTGSIHHWKDPVGGLNECHRVLKDGGVALMYDLVRQLPPDVAAAAKREFGRYRLALLWLHSFEEPFYSPQEMEALAAKSRFSQGQTRFVGVLCCLILRKSPPS